MKKIIIWVCIAVAIAVGAYFYFAGEEKKPAKFTTEKVERKDMVMKIDATGTVEPEDLITVAARVSGEIVKFGKDKQGKEVDYGSEIKEGEVIALIDDVIQQSNLLQANAKLEKAKASQAQAKANLSLAEANYREAERNWNRAQRLGVSEALSQSAYDAYLADWEQTKAQVEVAKAQILQSKSEVISCEADVKLAKRNLEYCIIKAPVDGTIIDRIVSVGQTVVSNMSASSLFLIAKDLKKMEVWASVNEADIGNIFEGQEVIFTVDAFPKEEFVGKVNKIRLNATMSQNVVTYIVEVSTDNSNLKLLPYLTANLSFVVKRSAGAIAIPNAALRWKPEADMIAKGFSAEEKEGMRNVWVCEGEGLVRPIPVKLGINDGVFSEVLSDNITEGMQIVTGAETVQISKKSTNPFMPKMPQRKKKRK